MNDKPLVSVILLSYNNTQYITQAIKSVLEQNYANIELIISDDCSEYFDKESILKYVEKNKRQNVRNLIINVNVNNLGTVKNINAALKYAKGEYIKLLAADDELYEENVLSRFVEHLKENGFEIVASRFAVCDESFQTIKYLLPEKKNIQFIENLPPVKLYGKLAVENIIGGVGVCMRRDLIYKYKLFDERYILTEDLPTWLILLRHGVKIGYMDFITVKYRENGVSNGDFSPATKILRNDLLKIIENEILPNQHMLSIYEKRIVNFMRINMYQEKNKLSLLLFSDVIICKVFKKISLYLRRFINERLSSV